MAGHRFPLLTADGLRDHVGRAAWTVGPQYLVGMASKRRPYRRTLGTPTSLVLYRNPEGWR